MPSAHVGALPPDEPLFWTLRRLDLLRLSRVIDRCDLTTVLVRMVNLAAQEVVFSSIVESARPMVR